MYTIASPHAIKRDRSVLILVTFSLLLSIFIAFSGPTSVYAVRMFSKDEKPFGVSYDDWVAKYWDKRVGMNKDQAAPKPGGCLILNNDNKSDSLVMLMDTAQVDGSAEQTCKISSSQGIMIPLWIAECDNSGGDDPRHKSYSDEQLTKCAREQYNLGNIRSDVKVDGQPIAKLDVKQSLIPGSGKLDYKVNSPLNNITDFNSKGFNLTIPPDSNLPLKPGTWRSGSQGWWVFLKPLPPGEHTISYNVRVTPTGALTSPGTNPHFADITYKLQVT
jgi:hypothetical protein